MKKTVSTILGIGVILLLFGCSALNEKIILHQKSGGLEKVAPEGCIQSKLDHYSYQSEIDPKTIFDEWTEIPELRRGSYLMAELIYKNPDPDADIPVAMFLVQGGAFVALAYLCDGEPRLFFFEPETDCYLEQELEGEQFESFRKRLFQALGWKGV